MREGLSRIRSAAGLADGVSLPMPPVAAAPCRWLRSILSRFLDAPETNVAIFAFLLNLTWELAQVPLFAGMPSAEHWQAILICGRATLGDVVIALVGFWAVAASARTRSWVLRPTAGQLANFVAVGVLITILMEWLATQVLHRWMQSQCPSSLSSESGCLPFFNGSSFRRSWCGSFDASSRERTRAAHRSRPAFTLRAARSSVVMAKDPAR
jgi:hypothetical protein